MYLYKDDNVVFRIDWHLRNSHRVEYHSFRQKLLLNLQIENRSIEIYTCVAVD